VQSCISYVLEGYAGETNDEQKDWLQRSSRRIDGLLVLITDLLDIPRIELGQLKQEMAEIPLNEVINHSLEGLDIVAKKKNLQLTVELPAQSPVIYGSSRRLQQVITNLTNNAINYTNEGQLISSLRRMRTRSGWMSQTQGSESRPKTCRGYSMNSAGAAMSKSKVRVWVFLSPSGSLLPTVEKSGRKALFSKTVAAVNSFLPYQNKN